MNPRYRGIFLRAARADEGRPQQRPDDLPPADADAPTRLDVLNGRGHRVHRHPGNAAYRELVSASRGRYARCPLADKLAISKGIVAAVRGRGGRFLELDKPSGTYVDIGDKKAWEKTSQALREGQKKIRQKLRGGTAANRFGASPPASSSNGRVGSLPQFDAARAGAMPRDGYFRSSAESPCSSDEGVVLQTSTALQRGPQTASSGGGLVEQTLVGRHVSPSLSPGLENEYSRVAAPLEDEAVRYLTQVCGGDLMLASTLLRRANAGTEGGAVFR